MGEIISMIPNREFKLNELSLMASSASEIDSSVDNKERLLIGTDVVDYTNGINLLDASKWIKFIIGSNTGTISNSQEFTKFNQNSLVLSQLKVGIAPLEGWKITFTEAQDFSSIEYFTIWVYLDAQPVQDLKSGSDFGSIMLAFGNSSFSNTSAAKINGGDFAFRKGWNNITIPKTSFNITIAGTLDWTNIGGFQFRIEGTSGSAGCSFYIDSIIAGGEKPNKIPVCITMDDGFQESFEMAEIMNKYGIPTSLFVMNEFVDDQINHPTYFTINDCKKLYNKGNHIGIHGITENEFVISKEKLLVAKEWLYNNGFTRDSGHLYGSYPNGSYNQTTIDYAKSIGIKSLRAITARNRDDSIGVEAYLHHKGVVPLMNGGIDDLFRIGSTKPLTLAAFTTYLNNAILYKGGLITYHHKFSEFTSKSEWILLAKYLKTKIDDGTIECLTYPKFCKKYSN
jgi:peptidoglycan/xylan/chitin deacetylase (PgdA/CDA1 family)